MMSPTLSSAVADRNRQDAGLGARDRLGTDLGQQRDHRQQLVPERDPLPERHQVALGVPGDHAALGIPPQGGGLALIGTRALHDGPDQDRPAGHLGGGLDGRAGGGVAEGIDIGGVLRPHDEVGLGHLAEPGLHRQVDRFGQMVVGHGAGPSERLDPPPRHVALHDADLNAGSGLRAVGLGELVRPQPEPGPDDDQTERDRRREGPQEAGPPRGGPNHERWPRVGRAARPGTRRRPRR